ncbi:MAG: crossover junction endodeoxyribonuclease RuvC [Ignavibacteriaceae bacterium]|nr:crossover junction endodeoxyribonuclease RuvC [Ignavibacteriaceae bacterium]
MIILGVDPGTNITGYGLIEYTNNKFRRISHGVIKLPSSKSLSQKLEIIYNELDKLLKRYKPDEFVIETAFYGKNVQSVLKIGYARGVSILAAIHNKVPTSEYSPREVKKAVVGKGAASKQQVNYMVTLILNSKKIKFKPDESDALAIALCHAFRLKAPSFKKSKSWKEFINANPERVIN